MMRKQFFMTSLVAASLVAGLTACDNDKLTQVNVNPNQPEHVQSQQLFTNATLGALGNLRGPSFEHGLGALWVQHYAEIQYAEADVNNPRGSTVEGLWNTLYSGALQDYTQILTQSANAPSIVGPTLVMRAFLVEEMTDLWGDMPFSEASKGSANLTPKYDTQAAIYDSLFASLTKAASITTGAGDALLAADPVYGQGASVSATTQAAQWVKLANSLHARAAMRVSNVDAAKSKAELAKALGDLTKVFQSNADNASMSWPGGTITNPLCGNWVGCTGTRDDQRISQRFVDTLKITGDPRLAKYAAPTVNSLAATATPCDSAFRGFPNGITEAGKSALPKNTCTGKTMGLGDYSRPTLSIRGQTSPSYIMTYSELLFIRAEAAQRGFLGTPADAKALYEAAITASMQQWGVSASDITAYLAKPGVVFSPANAMKQIAYEKWVSLFNLENEAYAEWRRLDYPVLKPGPNAQSTTVPTRLPYPAVENSLNAANLATASSAQGNVDIGGKVWWDKP
jgi:SusD/RagB-like outer membrane lipoprotein